MLEAMQNLQTEKEERERTVDDYETLISKIENNYKVNHQYTIVIGMITEEVMVSGNSTIELNDKNSAEKRCPTMMFSSESRFTI